MNYRIDISREVCETFPLLRVSALRAHFPSTDLTSTISALEPSMTRAIADFRAAQPLSAHPAIAPWRTAMARMGQRPSRFSSSLESLARRAMKDAWPTTGIPVVDLYNRASLAFGVPMGGYDEHKIGRRPITLRFARPGTDVFDPIGGEASDFPVDDKLVVYGDGDEILGWGINVRDSRKTAIERMSEYVVFLSESLNGEAGEPSRAMERFADILTPVADSLELVELR